MSQGVDGALGLRSGLKAYRDLVEDSSWSKRLLVELYPGKAVPAWTLSSGAVYVAPVDVSHDGVRLDVAKVSSVLDAELTRNRVSTTLAAGEYYYDVDSSASAARWDDAITQWDDGVTLWDDFAGLYARMSDDSDPSDADVEAELLMTFGSSTESHPIFGPDMLLNGSFEDWTADAPDSWTEGTSVVAGGTADTTENLDPHLGTSCASQVVADLAGGNAHIRQDITGVVAGRTYRYCGAYRVTGTGVLPVAIAQELGANTRAQEDGINWAASQQANLTVPQANEWRRFSWDFVIPAGATSVRLFLQTEVSGIGQGEVSWDDVHLYPVDRVGFYEPRVSGSSVPTVGTSSNDIFFGGKQVGIGSVALLNHDGYFETLTRLDWINRKCMVRVGGGYLPDTTDTTITAPTLIAADDYRTAFTGLIQEFKVDDLEVSLSLQDIRSTYFQTLPSKTYDETTFQGINLTDIGRARPLWFGAKSGIRPIRINSVSDYGVYELADCTEAPNGIKAVTNVWAYPSKADADARDISARVALSYKAATMTGGWTTSSVDITQANEHVHRSAGADAWDEGARSTSTLAAGNEDWYVEATVGHDPAVDDAMFGISTDNPDWDFDTLDYALYPAVASGFYEVYENGVLSHTSTVVPAQYDRLRIWVQDGFVEFHVNGTLLYTSTIVPSGNYYMRTAMSDVGSIFTGIYFYESTAKRYTEVLATGQITVTDDPGPYSVIAGEESISFGASLTAKIQPGLYSAADLATQVGAAMAGAAALTTYSASYSETTHLITIAGPSHDLKISSGTDKKLYGLLGFTGADRAAGTSHVGDVALFDDPDTDHVIRVDGQGFKDDASGTYTGTASALIEVGADILRAISLIWLKRPAALIDEASFQLARDRAPESIGAYMNKAISTKLIFETLEFSNIGNISIGGDGTIFYDVYVGDVPTGTVTVEDTDFTAFGITQEAADVYKTIRVNYDQDPEGVDFPSRFVTNTDVQARFGRPDSKDFNTWLVSPDGAQAAANRLGELAKAPAHQLRGTVRGKLLDHRVGAKMRVTRSRAATAGGLLSSAIYRIISLRQNYALGISQVQAIPDVVTVAGVACETACQSFCQTTCQETCETACQTQCQVTCQVGCEVACQECSQTGCQETCEVNCQTGCEASCQVTCQTTCQTTCQASCQTSCQLGCQTGCEVSCQDTCETTCQTACETSCQDSCELFCQTTCQLFCQDTCQTSCQSAYQQEYFP